MQMFGMGGAKCPRCEHKNAGTAAYCAQCGLLLGAPRNAPVLVDNRWIAGADELAVFFGVQALAGLFVKTLRVPATTRAYILQGGAATEVPQGDYEIEGFFSRLNNLLRDDHAEILITRSTPVVLVFAFDELASAEHLALSVQLSVSVQIEQVAAFARHFMTMPGTVSSAQLVELLAPSVRQLAAEFIAGQSLRDMSRNGALRAQFDERLQGGLQQRLALYGLAVVQVDTLSLKHDKFDAHRARIGSLWLLADERNVELEHAGHLDALYDDGEWQKIRRAEADSRLRYRRAELAQDDAIDKAELSLQNSERLQAVRAREIELYSRIVEAKNRQQAIAAGAGEVLAELEHEQAQKNAARGDVAADWAHSRHIAQIRMRTELELSQQQAVESRQLAQQRFSHQLLQQQIGNKVAQALLIEDETAKRNELARLRQARQSADGRQAAIEHEQHIARHQALALVNAAHAREAARLQEWEDQLAQERARELARSSGAQDALSQHEKLLRTIAADDLHSRNADQRMLAIEQARHQQGQDSQEAQWQQELRRIGAQREARFAELTQQADLARLEIARADSLGAMSDTAKLALAGAANAAVLADYLKTQVHAGMGADQLAALAAVVGATNSVTPQEALRLADLREQRDSARRERDIDKDRQHQLELIKLQNDVNKAALAAQSQLGIGVAGGGAAPAVAAAAPGADVPRCPHGHPVRAGERFCGHCGAALGA
ncbi:SPFH domain-containing protein [Massilia sp. PWRC2]|uniref:SPFH domain-containing protein n=1 Tax=Massilia sp. PWRC2 TaxID=2804626 RepID=UPI003CECDA18